MSVAFVKGSNIERHIVHQVGIRVSESLLVPGEDKVMKIIAESTNQPFVFT